MCKFQITFVFDKDTDEVIDLQCISLSKNPGVAESAPVVNNNAKVELVGNSLVLNDDILKVLRSKIGAKLVLKVADGYAQLINPKLAGVKGGNLVTGRPSIAAKGKVRDDLAELGAIFGFRYAASGVIDLIPVKSHEDVIQITEDLDDVISEEDIEALYNDDEETTTDILDLES